MRAATFIDTSVLLEVLRVPGKSQQPGAIRSELRERVDAGESLLLPTAAIVEPATTSRRSPTGTCAGNTPRAW
jgi:hypothetical protein